MFCLNNLSRIRNPKLCISRRRISVLYITGDKAKENYAPLTPYMDFNKRLGDSSRLQENISRRGLDVDLVSLTNKYKSYAQLQQQKFDLEKRREDVTNTIKHLDKTADASKVEELKSKAISIRTELKTLKESIYPVEDEFIHQFLALPNELHEKCPQNSEETLIYRNGLPTESIPAKESHLSRTDLIHFIDKGCYYLLDEAAEYELYCTHQCREVFTSNDFVSMTNPDFARKILIEANLAAPDQYHGVLEEDPRHNLNSAFLTGGGSFESFLGYLTKLSVYPSVLPLRLVSTGRQYKVKPNESSELGLYAATQSNVTQTLVASISKQEADKQLDDVLNLAVDFYKKIGLHFRIVFANASALSAAESLRASIQVYSPFYSRYMEVGHVSHYLDFVSQRILFSTKEKKETKFLHLVGGPIVTSSTLIAALIENQVPLNMSWNSTRPCQVEAFKSLFK